MHKRGRAIAKAALGKRETGGEDENAHDHEKVVHGIAAYMPTAQLILN